MHYFSLFFISNIFIIISVIISVIAN